MNNNKILVWQEARSNSWIALFESDGFEAPTCFTLGAPFEMVARELEGRNPGCVVELAQ